MKTIETLNNRLDELNALIVDWTFRAENAQYPNRKLEAQKILANLQSQHDTLVWTLTPEVVYEEINKGTSYTIEKVAENNYAIYALCAGNRMQIGSAPTVGSACCKLTHLV